jgi:hypothetical protein
LHQVLKNARLKELISKKGKMTLLTPMVIHRDSITFLLKQPIGFFKKYLFKFALIQGLFGGLISVLIVFTFANPLFNAIQVAGEKVWTHANLSYIGVKQGMLETDIKPSIWFYSVDDTTTKQTLVAVDSLGTMNKYYWDDRIQTGVHKKISGIGFLKNEVMVKVDDQIMRVPYQKLFKTDVQYTKKEALVKFESMVSQNARLTLYMVVFVVAFVVTALLGVLAHMLFALVVGNFMVLSSLHRKKIEWKPAMKVSLGLYVVWFYSLLVSKGFTYLCFGASSILGKSLLVIILTVITVYLAEVGIYLLQNKKVEVINSGNKMAGSKL